MREILFRGKRIDNGEWIEGHYIFVQDAVSKEFYHCIVKSGGEICVSELWDYEFIDKDTLSTFTGLTDKNGKKIFEGDICRIKEHGDVDLAVISFEHGAFYATHHNANIHEHTLWDIWYNDYDIEVIGNIYDNPELLEVTE